MNFLTNGLVLAGAVILICALIPVRRLVTELPSGQVRRQWNFLSALIFFVIAGYLAYAVSHTESRAGFSDLVVPMVFLLGACIVLALNAMSLQTAHDVRRMAVLELENITDPLIGIYNRRYLDRRLKQELARASRHRLPLSVLLIDVDHFKKVNDTFGHPVGDLALKALGKLIMGAIRIPDIVARYGGEEILVIAPDSPMAAASSLAHRLRQSVEGALLVPPHESTRPQGVRVTVSIGVATCVAGTTDMRTLLDRVDAAMYRAKAAGRNAVVVDETQAVS